MKQRNAERKVMTEEQSAGPYKWTFNKISETCGNQLMMVDNAVLKRKFLVVLGDALKEIAHDSMINGTGLFSKNFGTLAACLKDDAAPLQMRSSMSQILSTLRLVCMAGYLGSIPMYEHNCSRGEVRGSGPWMKYVDDTETNLSFCDPEDEEMSWFEDDDGSLGGLLPPFKVVVREIWINWLFKRGIFNWALVGGYLLDFRMKEMMKAMSAESADLLPQGSHSLVTWEQWKSRFANLTRMEKAPEICVLSVDPMGYIRTLFDLFVKGLLLWPKEDIDFSAGAGPNLDVVRKELGIFDVSVEQFDQEAEAELDAVIDYDAEEEDLTETESRASKKRRRNQQAELEHDSDDDYPEVQLRTYQ